ncbi:MAG: NADH:ubiquinone reductase (Na(+)-transporting) subunit C [Bacteroidetes bacterium HGW-Bacteroidetes-17]|nr:MAG: NADH:ubiquinone reductase (Na(+)-transporting) subunit C [Bacteroidetes bacterium HGW-Bacteroidetes-17]
MYSNFYIFRYASVMVIIVAAVLSSAAMFLKPYQERNEAIEKMKGILASAKIDATTENTIELYEKNVNEEIVINNVGDIVSIYKNGNFESGEIRAFNLDLKKELYKKSKGLEFNIPLLVSELNGEKIYIIPLRGTGLWGPIWGNIAVQDNFSTVIGVTFGHKGETPGLGAEIDTKDFQSQFVGKEIFEDGKFQSISVVKGGIVNLPENMKIHGVDAISGGTITSNAVTEMLANCLENYVPFITKNN